MKAQPTAIHLGMCVVSEYDDDGFVGIQVDAFGERGSGMEPFEALHPYGFEGRPLDRSAGLDGAQAFYWMDGDEGHVIPLGDGRGPQNLPQLSKGSSRQYNASGQFLLLDADADLATWYVPIDDGAKAHVIQIGKDANGADFLGIVQANGLAVTMLDDELVIRNRSGNVFIRVNDSDVAINGNTVVYGGITVGGAAGLPVMMAEAFVVWWEALVTAANLLGPTTPVTGSALATLLSGVTGGLTATQSTLLKGL